MNFTRVNGRKRLAKTLAVVAAVVTALLTQSSPASAQSHPDNQYWDRDFGVLGATDEVRALALDADGIYAGGVFDYIGGVLANGIAYWDGSQWHALGDGVEGVVHAIAVHDGKAFIGGHFTHVDTIRCNNVAYWDGQRWWGMDGGVLQPYGYPTVDGFAVFNGDLFAGGRFAFAGLVPVNGIARWDGDHWESIGFGLQQEANAGVIGAITSDEDHLYVSAALYEYYRYNGYHNYVTIWGGIATWDGYAWDEISSGECFNAIAAVDGDLCAGGWFTTILDGKYENNIAIWDGNDWTGMNGGTNGRVLGLHAAGSDLYAIGDFTKAGGRNVNGLARWDGTDWYPLGDGVGFLWYGSIVARGTGELFCGGRFVSAGGDASSRIARWYNPVSYPSRPIPKHNAVDQLNSIQLNWSTTGTPDDPVYYDVHLGTSPDPPLQAAGYGSQTYDPDTLLNASGYYWKVVAYDGSGNQATGNVWKFTVEDLVTSRLVVSSAAGRCVGAGGDTVTIDVTLEDANVAVGAAGFDLQYDPSVLTFLWCEPGDLTASWQTFECADLGTAVRVGGYNIDPIPQSSYGTFARLTFRADCCGFDTTSALPLELNDLIDDLSGLRPISGEYTCEHFEPDGDVNGDGLVTTTDAYCAFDGYFTWPAPLPGDCGTTGWETRGDVDCSGRITPGDAQCILSHYSQGDCEFCGDVVTGIRGASANGPPDVSITDVLQIGDHVVLTIAVNGGPPFHAFGFDVVYSDSHLVYDDSGPAELTIDFEEFEATQTEPGRVRFGGYRGMATESTAGTEIAVVRFQMLTPTPDGTITVEDFVDDLSGAQPETVQLDVVIGVGGTQPSQLALHQNCPNPFNPVTEIRYEIPAGSEQLVSLSIYNIEGKLVKRLVDQPQGAGVYRVRWQGRNRAGQAVASGVYFYVLRANQQTLTKKLVLLK